MKILTSNIRPDVKVYEVLIYLAIMFAYGYLGGRMVAEKEYLEQIKECNCDIGKQVYER